MPELDIDALLGDRSAENISGEDLEYDSAFAEMEKSSQGKPDQQYGETVIPGEPPDWRSVETYAKEVLDRSHDLRAATMLANAMLVQHGIESFASVIELIKGYIQKYWDTIHPVLDADDDNDPTIRVNALMSLCDHSTTMNFLSKTPLVSVRSIGQFSIFDWKVAHGELTWPESADGPAPDENLINAAFMECDVEELAARKDAVCKLLSDVNSIEETVTDKVGAAQSCNFDQLVKEITAIKSLLETQYSKRAPVETEVTPVESNPADSDSDSASPASPTKTGSFSSVNDLVLTTRQEAITAIDKICEYFERYEPSSPLPLLLKRARRLSTKSFLEIIRDISPDVLHQVESLGGLDDNPAAATSTPSPTPVENNPPPSSGDTY